MQDMTNARPSDEPSRGLAERERAMLELEARSFKYAGAKQEAIRALLQMSSAQYYQRLNRLIDTEEAIAFAPMVVRRLRESRGARIAGTRSETHRPTGAADDEDLHR